MEIQLSLLPLNCFRNTDNLTEGIRMIKKAITFFVLFCSALFFSGCTKLHVESYEAGSELTKALEGPLYYLPQGHFDIVVKRKILACDVISVSDASGNPVSNLDFKFAISAEVTQKIIPDLSKPYLIKFQELNGFTKKTTLKVNLFENGVLKSVNASVEDRTGSILANTTKGAVQIARMVMGLPSAPSALATQQPCNEETRKAITHFKTIKGNVDKLEKELPKYNASERPQKEKELNDQKALLAKYDAHISHDQKYAGVAPTFDAEGNWNMELPVSPSLYIKWFEGTTVVQPIAALIQEINKLKDSKNALLGPINSLEREIERLQKKSKESGGLTGSEQAQLGQNQTSLNTLLGQKDQVTKNITKVNSILKQMSAGKFIPEPINLPVTPGSLTNLPEEIRSIASELNAVAEMKVGKRKLASNSKAFAEVTKALIYRQPGPAELVICKFLSCELADNIIHNEVYQLPQAGIYSTLPLKNFAFDNNVLSATFANTGGLITFEYITEAQAEAASAAFAQSTGAAAQIIDAQSNKDVNQLKKELEKTELEIKLEKAKKEKDALIE